MAWKKGESGNPGGRPATGYRVRDLAREATDSAIATLIEVMMSKQERGSARVAAAQALLDRAWGRAPADMPDTDQELDVTRMSDEQLLALIERAASFEPPPTVEVSNDPTGHQDAVSEGVT